MTLDKYFQHGNKKFVIKIRICLRLLSNFHKVGVTRHEGLLFIL
jgi:hypothetical protein